jgi:hypothetical protein
MSALEESCAKMNIEDVKQAAPIRADVGAHATSLLAARHADVVVPGFEERQAA